MKSFQEKSNIAVEMIARAKLVNLQETYNDDELLDTMEQIEKEFTNYIEYSLANQNFYELFLDWLRANIKELIFNESINTLVSTNDVYLIASFIKGVFEVDFETFENCTYPELNEIEFYNDLCDVECTMKCKFPIDSTLLKEIMEDYIITHEYS